MQLTEVLKVNVLVTSVAASAEAEGAALHVDTLDLYQAKQRQVFAKSAAAEAARGGTHPPARSRPAAVEAGAGHRGTCEGGRDRPWRRLWR